MQEDSGRQKGEYHFRDWQAGDPVERFTVGLNLGAIDFGALANLFGRYLICLVVDDHCAAAAQDDR